NASSFSIIASAYGCWLNATSIVVPSAIFQSNASADPVSASSDSAPESDADSFEAQAAPVKAVTSMSDISQLFFDIVEFPPSISRLTVGSHCERCDKNLPQS